MKSFKQFLTEVRYINPNQITKETPLYDNNTIRVYHGFNKLDDAVYTIKYGLSGKQKAKRIYSYESGNNPNGLFVSINFNIAENFAYSKIIIEFSTKISNLDAPVWVGGRNYFIQGEYAKSFKDMSEREQQQLINRQTASQSPYSFISKSDRPELAQTIFDNPEQQALFVGDLNPNMIKRVWIKQNNSWLHITPEQFLKQNKNHKFQNQFDYDEKLFKPNEEFSIQLLYDKLINLNNTNSEESHRNAVFYIKEIFSSYYQSEYELSKLGFFPKQINKILHMYKTNSWIPELEKLENRGSQ